MKAICALIFLAAAVCVSSAMDVKSAMEKFEVIPDVIEVGPSAVVKVKNNQTIFL